MRSTRYLATDHPPHLPQLVHQVAFVVQAPCRVDDHDVRLPCHSGSKTIEGNGTGISAMLVTNEISARAFRPYRQLLDRRGPKGVSGDQQHPLPLPGVAYRQLADRRRLSDAIHSNDHDHVRRGWRQVELWVGLLGLDWRLQDRQHLPFEL